MALHLYLWDLCVVLELSMGCFYFSLRIYCHPYAHSIVVVDVYLSALHDEWRLDFDALVLCNFNNMVILVEMKKKRSLRPNWVTQT